MTAQPLVSVLMPVYNGEKYLAEAIDSILKQTYTNIELLILDDGSSDNSGAIVNSYDDDRIKYQTNGRNLGIVATRNKLLTFAKGDYIAIHDCDDLALPNKLAMQVAYLQEHKSCGLCGSWAKKIDEKGNVIGRMQPPVRDEAIKMNLLFQSSFVHSAIMMRRTNEFDIYYSQDFPVAMDFDLWERLSLDTKFYNIPKFLIKYRWHTVNISNKQKELQETRRNAIVERQLNRIGHFTEQDAVHIIAVGNLLENTTLSYAEMAQSLRKLVHENKKQQRFCHQHFVAFVWYRWIFYCAYRKAYKKILQLKLPLLRPKIFYFLSGLLYTKAKGTL